MGKIIVSEFLSLDGVIEAPENWHFPYVSDDMEERIREEIAGLDAALYGRVTYEVFASYWPTQTNNEGGIADKLNSMPKYVVSTTLEKADWHNTTLIKGNVPEEIARLKERYSGNISITGSATLAQSLMQAGLIDEIRLMVHPIVAGKGKRLFNEGLDTLPLKLVENRTYSAGVVLLVYQSDRK